jgi:hypothetical protein
MSEHDDARITIMLPGWMLEDLRSRARRKNTTMAADRDRRARNKRETRR